MCRLRLLLDLHLLIAHGSWSAHSPRCYENYIRLISCRLSYPVLSCPLYMFLVACLSCLLLGALPMPFLSHLLCHIVCVCVCSPYRMPGCWASSSPSMPMLYLYFYPILADHYLALSIYPPFCFALWLCLCVCVNSPCSPKGIFPWLRITTPWRHRTWQLPGPRQTAGHRARH